MFKSSTHSFKRVGSTVLSIDKKAIHCTRHVVSKATSIGSKKHHHQKPYVISKVMQCRIYQIDEMRLNFTLM